MDIKEILKRCDHTLLSQTATEENIKALCDEGIKYETASVCIPPCYVKMAKEYVDDKIPICTVIGFPNGYSSKEAKVYEAACALKDGADEIDMVINVGFLKARNYEAVLQEIKAVREITRHKTLKVIIETCLLTDEEKAKMCDIVYKSGADYIKTSTGFSFSGASAHDIDIFRENVKSPLKIKAAGGIKTLDDAIDFINRGADRLGTSRIVKLIKNAEENKDISY